MAGMDYFIDDFKELEFALDDNVAAVAPGASLAAGAAPAVENAGANEVFGRARKEIPAADAGSRNSIRDAALFCVVVALAVAVMYFTELSERTQFDASGNAVAPAEVRDAMGTAISYALNSAVNFNGKWGEWHKEMVASGLGGSYQGYGKHVSFLQELISQSKALNVFVIHRDEVGNNRISINMDDARKADVRLLDAAPIESAWMGRTAAESNPWDYEYDRPVWTAYAPIYDKEGEIAAVLGVDYPVPIIRSYPEWNKSNPRWNKYVVVL